MLFVKIDQFEDYFLILLMLIFFELVLSKDDRTLYERARKLENFLTQPMFVAESFTGKKGQFVKTSETLDSIEKIIDGRLDDRNESEFYMIGSL